MQLRPSWILSTYFVSLMLLVNLALYCVLPTIYWSISAVLLCAYSITRIGRLALLKHPQSWSCIRFYPDHIELENKAQKTVCCELLPYSTVAPYLIVLRLKPEHQRFTQSLILFPDSLNKHDFHQLRVLLRFAYNTVKI